MCEKFASWQKSFAIVPMWPFFPVYSINVERVNYFGCRYSIVKWHTFDSVECRHCKLMLSHENVKIHCCCIWCKYLLYFPSEYGAFGWKSSSSLQYLGLPFIVEWFFVFNLTFHVESTTNKNNDHRIVPTSFFSIYPLED